MATETVWLHKAPASPNLARSTWGARTWLSRAQWSQFDKTIDGKRINEQKLDKKMPSERAALALVEKWIAEKRADGWTPDVPTSAAKSKAKKVRAPRWLAKVDAKELARIRQRIEKADLGHRSAEIMALARPAIRFELAPAKSIEGVTTRFGGDPDLPADFAWPMHEATPLAFVAQYRLDELTRFDLEGRLPRSGVLAVFVYLVPDGDAYCEQARVFHFADPKRLHRTPAPHRKDADGRPGKQALAKPRLVLTLPSTDDRELGALRLTDAERERYHDEVWLAVRDAPSSPSKPGAHLLLGWDRSLLAQIDSDRRFGLEIGDVETLGVYLDPKKLAAKDFRRARASLQS